MVLRARGPDFRLPPAPADGRDRNRPLIVGAADARRAKTSRCSPSGSPGWTSPRPGSRSPSGCPATPRPGRRQQETRAFGTTRRELLALADWLRLLGRDQGRDGGHRRLLEAGVSSCSNRRGSTASCITPRRSRRCPGGPRPTGPTRSGWRKITERGRSALQLRAARSRSAGCAPTPATAGTSPRPAPPRSSGWRNCSKTGT